MATHVQTQVLIIGGGLAGLINAIQLSRAGLQVQLVEKKQYPFHKVCGEYISNEVLPFLHSIGVAPEQLGASRISKLQVSSPNGTLLQMPLDLGGFGLSRYVLDHHLYQVAQQAGVEFILGTGAEETTFHSNYFDVRLSNGTLLRSELVIGAFGKRSKMDQHLQRPFLQQRSSYMGIKYHVKTRFPRNVIALHNFRDGYCGICAIEADTYNLCYLTTRDNVKKYGGIPEMEEQTLYQNPHMQIIRKDAVFLHEKPEVINEVSFAPKMPVEHHILMSGDTAGLITPLCGNGMAMAIHSASILSELVIRYYREKWSRVRLEQTYAGAWKRQFERRLWIGRKLQYLFGNEQVSNVSVSVLRIIKPLTRYLINQTHGQPFG